MTIKRKHKNNKNNKDANSDRYVLYTLAKWSDKDKKMKYYNHFNDGSEEETDNSTWAGYRPEQDKATKWERNSSQKVLNLHSKYKNVLRAFSPEKAAVRLQADMSEFGTLPGFEVVDNVFGKYYFQDNGANILAVAHLDSVHETNVEFTEGRTTTSRKIAFMSQTVDDRLGAYIIIDLLPKLLGDKPYDILLTEGEEIGASTAMYFSPPENKQYNWMFSFDREGIDVVLYQYDTPEVRQKLKQVGFTVGIGSFSDIAYLDELGVTGFNFGTGYYDNHSREAFFVKSHTLNQVSLFVEFYQTYKDERMEAKVTTSRGKNARSMRSGYSWYSGRRSNWDDYWDDERIETQGAFVTCPYCWYHNRQPALLRVKPQSDMHCQKCGMWWYRSYTSEVYRIILNHEYVRCAYCNSLLTMPDKERPSSLECKRCDTYYHACDYPVNAGKERLGIRLIHYGGQTKSYQEHMSKFARDRNELKLKPSKQKEEPVPMAKCDYCNMFVPEEELTPAGNSFFICDECLSEYGFDLAYCPYCGEVTASVEEYCINCGGHLQSPQHPVLECYVCGAKESEEHLATYFGNNSKILCDYCAGFHVKRCVTCGRYYFHDYNVDNISRMCSDCLEKPMKSLYDL